MPMYQNDIFVAGATQIAVGLSAIVACRPHNYAYGRNIKIHPNSGASGILELISTPMGSSLSGAGASGWGSGYPIGSAESVTFDGPCTFYLAATGQTMIAAVLMGKTAGATFY